MGHFIIDLPNNQQGDVRWGTIRKKSFSLNFFKGNKAANDKKRGYIVNVNPASAEKQEYRFLKTMAGNWTSEPAGGFQVTPDDQVSIAIKLAIDKYENQH